MGHPSGRLINEREGGDYDWEALFHAAAQHDVALEINSDPMRLDLDENARPPCDGAGLPSEHQHRRTFPAAGLGQIHYGITIARRAWVTPDVVINTWPLRKLLSWVKGR